MNHSRSISNVRIRPVSAAALAVAASMLLAPGAWAEAGNPLPRCAVGSQSFYLARFAASNPPTTTTPTVTLDRLTLTPGSPGSVAASTLWSSTAAAPGATVAMGMNPRDGYIYAMRATDADLPPAKPYEVLRYGAGGYENLGQISDLPVIDQYPVPFNFNAADFNPATGEFLIASFTGWGNLTELIRVDVTTSPPSYLGTITLSSPIPGETSGDFAIDATGTYAYGVARSSTPAPSGSAQAYRINLSSGMVENLGSSITSVPPLASYGGVATLHDGTGNMAAYGSGGAIRILATDGTLSYSNGYSYTEPAKSADAASCLPKYIATLQCTPTPIFDSAGNASTCTVTLDQPATADIAVALTPPAGDARYTTDCGDSLTVLQGQTTAQCTIAATPNTVAGDGNVTATLALAAADPAADYELGASGTTADVLIQDDDNGVGPVQPVPTLGAWGLLLTALGLGGLAWRRRAG